MLLFVPKILKSFNIKVTVLSAYSRWADIFFHRSRDNIGENQGDYVGNSDTPTH